MEFRNTCAAVNDLLKEITMACLNIPGFIGAIVSEAMWQIYFQKLIMTTASHEKTKTNHFIFYTSC